MIHIAHLNVHNTVDFCSFDPDGTDEIGWIIQPVELNKEQKIPKLTTKSFGSMCAHSNMSPNCAHPAFYELKLEY